MPNLLRLKFFTAFLPSGLLLASIASCSDSNSSEQSIITVLANDQMYQERPEPETLWYGVLGEAQRMGEPPPNQRLGLYYRLITDSETYLLYTKEIIPQLEEFLDRAVIVKGKFIVPPDDVAVSEELWPATVQLNEGSN